MRILLHICCAPCSVRPVELLEDEGVDITGFFYNPNIHPADEFARRREGVVMFSRIKGIEVEYVDEILQEAWERFDGDNIKRCSMCYSLRLERAASYARDRGFDAYSTTLLVSPYQKHELIRELGEKFALKYGVKFLYRDFRPEFRRGQQKAKEIGLYRQKFCGCIISKNESRNNKAKDKTR